MGTQLKLRGILRWVHIVLGLVIMCYVYSPFGGNRLFQIAVKFFVVPIIVLSGLWLWQFAAFNRFFRIR